jgi:hypothetical protein
MRGSIWIVITVVAGLVGFLVGYSASGYRDARLAQQHAGEKHAGPPAHSAAAQPPASGGYGN